MTLYLILNRIVIFVHFFMRDLFDFESEGNAVFLIIIEIIQPAKRLSKYLIPKLN